MLNQTAGYTLFIYYYYIIIISSSSSSSRPSIQQTLTFIISPERIVGGFSSSNVGGRRRTRAMSSQKLFEVAERQVLQDDPLRSGGCCGITQLLGPAALDSQRVHAAE